MEIKRGPVERGMAVGIEMLVKNLVSCGANNVYVLGPY